MMVYIHLGKLITNNLIIIKMKEKKLKVTIPEALIPELKKLKVLTKVRKAIKAPWSKRKWFSKWDCEFMTKKANQATSLEDFIDSMCPWEFTEEGHAYWIEIKYKKVNS